MVPAYAVLTLDVSVSPPRVLYGDIYSETTPTHPLTQRRVVVLTTQGRDFHEAREMMQRKLHHPENAWFRLLMPQKR